MDNTLAAYLAGFFDGEGSISVNVNRKLMRWSLRLSCHQVNPAPLRLFVEVFGGSIRLTERAGNQRAIYEWVAAGIMGAEALRQMRPYLRVKGEEADVALRFHGLMKSRSDRRSGLTVEEAGERERLYQELRDLKHLDYSAQTAITLTPPRPVAKPKPPIKHRHKVAVPVISAQGRTGRPSKGESRAPVDAADVAIFAAIYRDHGPTEAAREYGVSRQTIFNWLDRYGIERTGRTEASEARRKAASSASWVSPRGAADGPAAPPS